MKLLLSAVAVLISCLTAINGKTAQPKTPPSAAGTEPPSLGSFPLTFKGIGPIKIGSTLAQLEAMGYYFSRQDNNSTDAELGVVDCVNTIFFARSNQLGALFSNGRVERIDVLYGSDISTEEGIHLNSKENDVRHAYRDRLIRLPDDTLVMINGKVGGNPGHPFNPHASAVRSPDGKSTLLIETDGTDVMALHVGPTNFFWSSKEYPVFIPNCTLVQENGGWTHQTFP